MSAPMCRGPPGLLQTLPWLEGVDTVLVLGRTATTHGGGAGVAVSLLTP